MRETLTAAEVADLLGCAVSTVHQNAKAGSLPAIRMGDRTLFPRVAIEHLLRTGVLPPAELAPAESASARLLLQVELAASEARTATLRKLLDGIDSPTKPAQFTPAPPARPAKRCSRVVVREI